MADASIPFVRGQNVKLRLYQNNKPIYVMCKTHSIEENATEANDGVGGEDRDRLDKVTNFYSLTLDVFQQDQSVMDAYMASQDTDDAGVIPLAQSAALLLQNRNGTRGAYSLQEAKIGPFKADMGGRGEAYMMNLKIRFRYFKKIPSL